MKVRQLGIIIALPLLMSCSTLPPYQRGKLADPIMLPDEDNVNQQMEEKSISIQEGAKGMGSGSGGGCGC